MKLWIAQYEDYRHSGLLGVFDDLNKAQLACEADWVKVHRSEETEKNWEVVSWGYILEADGWYRWYVSSIELNQVIRDYNE